MKQTVLVLHYMICVHIAGVEYSSRDTAQAHAQAHPLNRRMLRPVNEPMHRPIQWTGICVCTTQ